MPVCRIIKMNVMQKFKTTCCSQVTVLPESRWQIHSVVGSLMIITVFAKIFGFAEKIVIAHYFGTNTTADVYFLVMTLILSLVFFIRELIYPTLLPVFTQTLSEPGSLSGDLFKKSFLLVTTFLLVSALSVVTFAPSITGIYAAGFSDLQQKMTVYLLRLLAPGLVVLGLMMVTYTALNARKKFLVSAFGEMALKMLIVVGMIVIIPWMGVYAIAPVACIGGLICLLFHLYYLPERRSFFQSNSVSARKQFKKVLYLMGPLILGVFFSHLSGLVDNHLASRLPEGQLSYLNYAKKIIDAVLLIGPIAIVTVVYAQLSHLASQEKQQEMAALISKAVRVLLYLSVPLACMLLMLKDPFLRCLFQHGKFDISSTAGTSRALAIYSLGLVSFSLEALIVYSFFALSDTKTPVILGIICVILDIILAVAFLRTYAYLGIAAALVISKTIKVVMLGQRLRLKVEGLWNISMITFIAKLTVACALLSITVKYINAPYASNALISTAVFNLMIPALAGIFVLLLASYLLKIEETRMLISILKKRTPV